MTPEAGARWLLYGAYVFTGRLIAERAASRGHAPILAGRNADRLTRLADRLGLEHRAFGLEDPEAVTRGLGGVGAVLNAAGPFEGTYEAMVEGCLAAGCHYVDVTGEITVLEAIMALNGRARDAGVALVPGMGFDVVPTDCLAAAVAARIPGATHLDIAFLASGRPSGGSMKGILDGLARPGAVRRDGEIVAVPHGAIRRSVPFADGSRELVAIPWGDVSTAFHSTGVPNVRVFTRIPRAQLAFLHVLRPLLKAGAVRAGLKSLLAYAGGPGDDELEGGWARVWAEAWDESGAAAQGELVIPNGYAFTADSALVGVLRLLGDGRPPSGAVTPSQAFGPDFVDDLDGVRWIRRPG